MSYPRYLNLNIGARGRMAALQAAADKLNANPHRAMPEKIYTWRDMRYSGFHNAAANCATLSHGFNTDARGRKIPIYYSHCGPEFPREKFADECESVRIDHTGWYADDIQYATIRGIVVALPHGRFLAGYYMSDNGERVYYTDIYDDERDAAYTANSIAERIAEIEREHAEKCTAAANLQFDLDEKIERLRECLALRNNPCFTKLRSEAAELIESIRDMRETLKTEYADVL